MHTICFYTLTVHLVWLVFKKSLGFFWEISLGLFSSTCPWNENPSTLILVVYSFVDIFTIIKYWYTRDISILWPPRKILPPPPETFLNSSLFCEHFGGVMGIYYTRKQIKDISLFLCAFMLRFLFFLAAQRGQKNASLGL